MPSDANFLSSPIVTPSSAAIGARIVGTCSAILLNSSPCKRPEPKACANCLKAFELSIADAPASFAAVLNPINVVLISSTPTPKGCKRAVIFVIPSSASVALNPNNFCASAAISCDFAKVPDALVNNPSLTFNFSKFADVNIACLPKAVTPTPRIAALRPPNAL